MAWAKNGTPDTLSGTSDTITISDLTSTKFNQNIANIIGSGSVRNYLRMGNSSIDTGSNYASRYIDNGSGADNTSTSQTELQTGTSFTTYTATLDVYYIINISTEEKLVIGHTVHQRTAGATTAPDRIEWVGKWDNTSNQYDQFQHYNNNTGDFASGSNFSALGTD